MNDIIVDNFAGGGGASTGIEAALGRPIDYAINHDPLAIAMHRANHPQTVHLTTSVWDVNPRALAAGREVALGWFSPDCTFHSKARGGKPFRDRDTARRRRGLAWLVPQWMRAVRPRVVMLENVEEFADWGPLGEDGRPCPIRKGMTFRRWVKQIQNLGYSIDMRELRACDYGAPTTRKRLFVIARCDGEDIVFPEAIHGPGRLPYRTAAECIDWSIPCPSIFERSKPLADNTLRRIARVAGSQGGLVAAFLARHYGGHENDGSAMDAPMHTITTKDHHGLVTAFLIKYFGTDQDPRLERPLDTVTTKDRFGLVTVHGEPYRIVDIGMRMLQPRELFRAQSFADSYEIERGIAEDGEAIAFTKGQQVHFCGNSVPPVMAKALVRANVCTDREERRTA